MDTGPTQETVVVHIMRGKLRVRDSYNIKTEAEREVRGTTIVQVQFLGRRCPDNVSATKISRYKRTLLGTLD
jgi:hypothetical protein